MSVLLRDQIRSIAFLLGIPLLAFLLLVAINPRYELLLIRARPLGLILAGAAITLEIIGFMALVFGTRAINRLLSDKLKQESGRKVLSSILVASVFFLVTIPALAIVVIGPAFVMLVEAHRVP